MGNFTFQIEEGNNRYLLKLNSFTEQELVSWQLDTSVEMYEVVLLRVSGDETTSFKSLAQISTFVKGFMYNHPAAILYFYCDDMHDILRAHKHADYSPQQFRSYLFSALFDREMAKHPDPQLTNNIQTITIEQGTAYIHLITSRSNQHIVTNIFNQLIEYSTK